MGATALATAVVIALTAGATGPSYAAQPAPTALKAQGAERVGNTTGRTDGSTVTLLTGDRVLLDPQGKVTGLIRAQGREHIPVRTQRTGDSTFVLPHDAEKLIRAGKVDRGLFDVTELSREQYRKTAGTGVPFIVTYRGKSPAAKAALRATADPEIRAGLPTVNGEAVTVAEEDAAAAWKALTEKAGTDTVSLDRIRQVRLDKSVPQIGTPAAWQAGYQGEGTTIAILDTGIDTTHKDLSGTKVVASKNFSDSRNTRDLVGHGTHVASIAAGTGAASGGKYKGVAPKARLLNAKVLDDDGYGFDSGIIEGMEWAVARGAKVINLSLGGGDTADIDPMEEAVNKLSASSGALFVIAAGNEGPNPQSVGTPGSADAALTVGAVDKKDKLAEFSSVGPRIGDGAVKPDLTAPGVDIGAAAAKGSLIEKEGAPVAPGYVAISGTSMATPHVAGAAALLAQQHPDWSGERIKSVLTASTKAAKGYSAFQTGSGRADLARAINQQIVAEPSSISFGTAQWPHTDDKPITKPLTYRNLGDTDVTLKLAGTGTGPTGKPAPAGMFTLAATELTVPAGGTATVDVTADTRPGGNLNGGYSLQIAATGGGQVVRTAAAVDREAESYNVTMRAIGRDGKPAKDWFGDLVSLTSHQWVSFDPTSPATVRLPKGAYTADASVGLFNKAGTAVLGIDWLVTPMLNLTKDTTLVYDARKAKPMTMTVADKKAKQTELTAEFEMESGRDIYYGMGFITDGLSQGFRTAQVGALPSGTKVNAAAATTWTRGATEYRSAHARKGSMYTGLTQHTKQNQMAKVVAREGASAKGRTGVLVTTPTVSMGGGFPAPHKLPRTTTVYVRAAGLKWGHDFYQLDKKGDFEAVYQENPRAYTAGKSRTTSFNHAVFAPKLGKYQGLFRSGNTIYGAVNPFADAAGHLGGSTYTKASTTLYRNGNKFRTVRDVIDFAEFEVPAGKANYRLVTTIQRSGVATVSTKVSASYSFTSQRTNKDTALPASAVRFAPKLALDATAKAGSTLTVPVKVEGSAAGKQLKSLTVQASYDGGKKWTTLKVTKGKVKVKTPKKGKAVSFKAKAVDKKGNTTTQTLIDAYRGK
ncbi:S8 family serine peptidase [Streptomyces sp. 549]|uniref:S8 family peptidase n=1 Tax=Streptomyces sp. 549 TaxID=3049076 RepID=UPI0024C45B7F|nr:S8 family serine peptidase [Streptomyces sp. 549]MDK1472642.1 S8 family serine peptidase [Streptomyces sp. 549]